MSFEQKQYWLKGREYEREQIIKLLEARRDEFEKLEWWLETELITDCIALINKGETK